MSTLNLRRTLRASDPEVIRHLLRKPEIRAASIFDAKPALYPKRHFRRDSSMPVQHTRQRNASNAKLIRGLESR